MGDYRIKLLGAKDVNNREVQDEIEIVIIGAEALPDLEMATICNDADANSKCYITQSKNVYGHALIQD